MSFGDIDIMTDNMQLDGKCSNQHKPLMCCEENPHKKKCKVRIQVQEVKSISAMKRTLNLERKRFNTVQYQLSRAVLIMNACSNCVSQLFSFVDHLLYIIFI